MLSRGFKVVSPKLFEIDIEELTLKKGHAIIKIDYAAICKADLRYYLGQRDERTLGLKYPMRLIHEATGVVLKDPDGNFEAGDKVVLVPNICDCSNCTFSHLEDKSLGANYCPLVKFASSNYDGFSAECICFPTSNIIKYNDQECAPNIAVFSELISVCCAAIRRVNNINYKRIGIWGDGILGYILSQVLKEMGKEVQIIAIGKHRDKLSKFECDEIYLVDELNEKNLQLDLAFECIGGRFAEHGINQMLEHIRFGADIVLTGVSEEGAQINTRRILEKGVRITGSTRSTVEDFQLSVDLLKNESLRRKIKELILSENIVTNLTSYYSVFEKEAGNSNLGKHLIKFNL